MESGQQETWPAHDRRPATAPDGPPWERRVQSVAKDVYLICPVRNATDEERAFATRYVEGLEAQGVSVHYPPRDVDQTDDGVGLTLNATHRQAMFACKEVHVLWNPKSTGSHFDLGMAFMLGLTRDLPIVLARPVAPTEARSYSNILRTIAVPSRLRSL
jgi:hypothetical protein